MSRIAGLFGKRPPRLDHRTLLFAHYDRTIAPPPPKYSNLQRVYDTIKVTDPAVLFPMDGNDQYGDCTWAGMAHAMTVYHGLVGMESVMTASDVVQGYLQFTGGHDAGCIELDVLNYWRQNKVGEDQILAYVAVDPKNHVHVEQAIQLFGGVYIGMAVTDSCQDQFSQGVAWTPGTLIPNEGHCVFVTDYDPSNLTVLTWGGTQAATWGWWDECVEECYAILPPEASDPRFAPDFDLDQLKQDLLEVTK